MTTTTNNERIEINGTTYEIVAKNTPESCEAEGRLATAQDMHEMKQTAQLYLKRVKGSRHYFAVQFTNGGVSNPVSLRF